MSENLTRTRASALEAQTAARLPAIEWPTVALAAFIYGSWLALTWHHAALPLWVLAPLGAWLVCWQSSLQHEVLHGHPTRSRALNRAIGFPPLALWLPYDRYRATHLQHHNDERLTDPLDDPESRYWRPEDWAALHPLGRVLVRAQATMLGRLVIGPFWAVGTFLWSEARAIAAGDRALARVWAWHAVAVAVIAAWIVGVCGMSLLAYALACALPGTSLMLIRSFCEHRAERDVARRTAIVEGHGPLALLFLFNSLHAVHHAHPQIAWYRLPGWFHANRARLLEANGGLLYHGYGDVFRRFLLRPHDTPLHPFGRAPCPERQPPAAPQR
jgi:fatty acid desaturase